MLKRVKTVGSVGDFLEGSYKYKKLERRINKKLVRTGLKVAITVAASGLMLNVTLPHAMAIGPEAITVANPVTDALGGAVSKALQPLIDVLKELATPIAGVMVTWGCLRYMIGQKEAGIGNIQQAAIGYILVHLSPMILNLITGVGGAVA